MRSVVEDGLAWWRMFSAALSLEEIQFAMATASEMWRIKLVHGWRIADLKGRFVFAEEKMEEHGDFLLNHDERRRRRRSRVRCEFWNVFFWAKLLFWVPPSVNPMTTTNQLAGLGLGSFVFLSPIRYECNWSPWAYTRDSVESWWCPCTLLLSYPLITLVTS